MLHNEILELKSRIEKEKTMRDFRKDSSRKCLSGFSSQSFFPSSSVDLNGSFFALSFSILVVLSFGKGL